MKTLIIDAVSEKIFLVIISNKNIYTSTYKNSKNNFDKLTLLIDAFLKKNRISINQIGSLYVNRGPGSFAGIRTSLSIVKGIHFTKKIDYFSFSYSDFVNEDQKKINNWIEVPSLCKKYKIKKNLINPLYLS
jgi:tRNA A37 threonylcarbamoyladenosine modification protein TsaB